MTILKITRKCDLLALVEALGLKLPAKATILSLKELVINMPDYNEKLVKEVLDVIINEREEQEKIRKQEREDRIRKEEREFELEKLRIEQSYLSADQTRSQTLLKSAEEKEERPAEEKYCSSEAEEGARELSLLEVNSSDQFDCYNSDFASRSSSDSKRHSPVYSPSLQYSKEDLMEYAPLPLSQNRPSCLDPAYNSPTGKWAPERWFMNHRIDRIPSGDGSQSKRKRQDDDIVSHKRKSSDSKEHGKEVKDDIVLIPQRKSFGTGCHVIQQTSLVRKLGGQTDGRNSENSKNCRDHSRKIGSGHIMTRDRDQRYWERGREYIYGSNRNDRRDRFYDNETDMRHYSNRYNRKDRRTRGRYRIDEIEPEWLSGYPTNPSEAKIQDVQNYPLPKTKTQIRDFLDQVGYYSQYIEKLSLITTPQNDPLIGMIRKGDVVWSQKGKDTFITPKEIERSDPVLFSPDFKKERTGQTDVSNIGMVVVHAKINDSRKEHPVLYLSERFSNEENISKYFENSYDTI